MHELEALAKTLLGKLETMEFHGEPIPALPVFDVWSDLEPAWKMLTAKEEAHRPLCLCCDEQVTTQLQLINKDGSDTYWQGFCTFHSIVVAVEWRDIFGSNYVRVRTLASVEG